MCLQNKKDNFFLLKEKLFLMNLNFGNQQQQQRQPGLSLDEMYMNQIVRKCVVDKQKIDVVPKSGHLDHFSATLAQIENEQDVQKKDKAMGELAMQFVNAFAGNDPATIQTKLGLSSTPAFVQHSAQLAQSRYGYCDDMKIINC